MYNSVEIADKIRETAKENKITIRELLNKCDLGINAVSQLAKGQNISSFALAKIADCLNCSVDYLLGRELITAKNDNTVTYYKKGQRMEKQLTDEQMEAVEKLLSIM